MTDKHTDYMHGFWLCSLRLTSVTKCTILLFLVKKKPHILANQETEKLIDKLLSVKCRLSLFAALSMYIVVRLSINLFTVTHSFHF